MNGSLTPADLTLNREQYHLAQIRNRQAPHSSPPPPHIEGYYFWNWSWDGLANLSDNTRVPCHDSCAEAEGAIANDLNLSG